MMRELRQLFEVTRDLVARLELVGLRMTETADLYRGLIVNQVLYSGRLQIGTDGTVSISLHAPYAALAVLNMTAAVVVVSNSPPTSSAPGTGTGSAQIPAGAFARRNLSGRVVTLYGTAGAVVDLEVLARPVDPVVNSA